LIKNQVLQIGQETVFVSQWDRTSECCYWAS